MEKIEISEAAVLSGRANDLLQVSDPATSSLIEVFSNQYDSIKNPKGKINLCTAENTLCDDLFHEKMDDMKVFKPNIAHLLHYPVPGGYDKTKEVLIAYFSKFLKVDIKKENLILAPGVTGAYDMLAFTICDRGDSILCPSPYYGRVKNDFKERAAVNVLPVPFEDAQHPKLDSTVFEKYFQKYIAEGSKIAGVVLINPQNPHGNVFPKEQIIEICDWAYSRNLNVIIDEIFASSVYFETEKFESFLSFRNKLKKPERVFWVWGFSKDLCMPGTKVSVVHSEDARATKCLSRVEILQPCSPIAQDFAANFLSDLGWLEKYHSENIRRLGERCKLVQSTFKKMGVPFAPCTAGFYIYLNFEKYLTAKTHDAEYDLWRKFCEEGVYLSTGKYFADTHPGWMRMVFSVNKEMLLEGMKRIENVLRRISEKQLLPDGNKEPK